MKSWTRSDVTSRLNNYGFLYEFNRSFASIVYLSQVIRVFHRPIMAVCRLRPQGGVLNRKLRHRSKARPRFFLLVFDTHYLSGRRHSVVVSVFWIFYYGGIAISTARGRARPEVTSPVNRVTMVSYSCSSNIFHLCCTVPTLFMLVLQDWITREILAGRPYGQLRHFVEI
jgi:hypothetical protein